jgi:hypothetical protein
VKTWIGRALLIGCLVAGGCWAWKIFFPGPESLVRKRLAALAETASIPANEASLAHLAKAEKLLSFFTPDAEVKVEAAGRGPQSLSGADDLRQAALAARAALGGLKVEFLDLTVQVRPDGRSAVAHFTGRAQLPGERMPEVQELKATLTLSESGSWLIKELQTISTLH